MSAQPSCTSPHSTEGLECFRCCKCSTYTTPFKILTDGGDFIYEPTCTLCSHKICAHRCTQQLYWAYFCCWSCGYRSKNTYDACRQCGNPKDNSSNSEWIEDGLNHKWAYRRANMDTNEEGWRKNNAKPKDNWVGTKRAVDVGERKGKKKEE